MRAATSAMIGDLEPGEYYLLDGQDQPANVVVDRLLELAASEELGPTWAEISFRRSTSSRGVDEYRIVPTRAAPKT